MKRNVTSKPFPSAEQMAAALAAAPDRIDDPECPYDPNDAEAVGAYWDNAIVSHSLPELREKLAVRRRGPGKRPAKEQVAVRYSVDVLAAFRASGPGWQARMDEALRDWLKTHSPARG